MVKIIKQERKSSVLRQPTLPCLSRYHTINLLAGCPYRCRYCYAKSFRSYRNNGSVIFYSNTYELLKLALNRKRRKPICVYFSTACEPFVPDRGILDALYDSMKLLLEYGIALLISTKSQIPKRFISLFAEFSDLIHVQVGLTTVDDEIRKLLEPGAFSVEERLDSIPPLLVHNISVELRMDPLVPGLTDTEKSFSMLCESAANSGIKTAAVSYLFIRQSILKSMNVTYMDWAFLDVLRSLFTEKIERYCGKSSILVADTEYRRSTYDVLHEIAGHYGLTLRMCRCKNPDLTTECCHPDMSAINPNGGQIDIFFEGGRNDV